MLQIDGNPFDMATFIVAVAACFIRPIRRIRRGAKPYGACERMALDMLEGTIIIPFLLLVGSVFSSVLLAEALRTSKLFMGVGGLIGLLFVLRDYFVGD